MTRVRVKTGAISAGATAGLVVLLLSASQATAAADGRDLTEALKTRDARAVQALLREGVDVNTALADQTMPLHWASHWDDLETAAALLRAGARVNVADDIGTTLCVDHRVIPAGTYQHVIIEEGNPLGVRLTHGTVASHVEP